MGRRGDEHRGGPAPAPGDGRHETENERLDRNWAEILQELRVTQTGTQILTGFLLALAFQPRFGDLDPYQRDVYLVLFVMAVIATVLGLAPVTLHRTLFRMGAKRKIVDTGNRILAATLVAISLVLAGTVHLIFDVIVGRTAGVIAGALCLAGITVLWWLVPLQLRRRRSG